MQQAGESANGTMLTVVGLEDDVLLDYCNLAGANSVASTAASVGISNYLFPRGRVIAGNASAVEAVRATIKENHGRRVIAKPLAVSGAFHTELMRPAEAAVVQALEGVDIQM